MALTIQSGIKRNTKDYDNFCYWLNGVDVTDQNLDQFTPYIQGVSRIFFYKIPPFLNHIMPKESMRFKHLVESGFTRIDGIQDTNVETVDFEDGFGGQKFRNVSLASNDTDTITISIYEQSGSPIREYLDAWVTGMRDIRSGFAHYHGALDEREIINDKGEKEKQDGVLYGEKYHTGEFIYCTMDPTGRHIEYACMFAHAFPTKVPKSHLNYETRNRGNVLMDLEFAVQLYESPAINAIANYLVANSKVEYNYLKFTPNLPNDIVNTTYATKNTLSTAGTDIFSSEGLSQKYGSTGGAELSNIIARGTDVKGDPYEGPTTGLPS